MNNELEKCFAFILELEKLKAVERKVKPIGLERYENSAEHSWQLAVAALVLAKFSNEPVNAEKTIKMLIVHDICEIDANDAFFFDEAARSDAKAKELPAAERIFGMLPEENGKELFELWNEFENGRTAEAKFARAIDRVMPVLQNLYNNKQSWIENNVTKKQILDKTAYIGEGSEQIWEAVAEKINCAFE